MSVSNKSKTRSTSTGKSKTKGVPGGALHRRRQNSAVGGIHNRRDKRFPFAAPHVDDAALETEPAESSTGDVESIPSWKEAIMLWLSWNATFEKVTARMYKPGQDQQKLEAMMDEMDRLRQQAIDLSEGLIR